MDYHFNVYFFSVQTDAFLTRYVWCCGLVTGIFLFIMRCGFVLLNASRRDFYHIANDLIIWRLLGQFFFPLFFVFSLTCYRVFFFFSLSGILLITLLCYVLYVNFVIVCYLALFITSFYVSISVTAFVEVDYLFPRWPWPPTLLSSAFGKQLRFHRFSLISFCSRLKVVFLYCNYYFFALCRNLLFWVW